MKAMLMTSAGGPEVLAQHDVEKPDLPTPHHLRVKLSAAAINPPDAKLRARAIYHPDKLPAILGCDGAGIVERTGSNVTRFRVGDPVFFNNGGLVSYALPLREAAEAHRLVEKGNTLGKIILTMG